MAPHNNTTPLHTQTDHQIATCLQTPTSNLTHQPPTGLQDLAQEAPAKADQEDVAYKEAHHRYHQDYLQESPHLLHSH